ncbi:MAG: hypothetical protein EZS28_012718 [Streblomastix strix]|uniref:DDE-1 domain-containing protein n=1 Tax=Streblomastix strix TaxID=222440 RepID=A0A5J4WA05_9EUKA|nr:MAG: hypothetical protein EZS28_012718 [Streblomastix strix]
MIVRTLFQLDVSHMFVFHFDKHHQNEIEIVHTSLREYRRMRLQYEDVQTYISIQIENVHRVLAVLISNVDESGVWTFSDDEIKHFLVPASITQDVSLYGVECAEAFECSTRTGNLNSDLFVRWLKECYFPDLDAKRVTLKQRNALAILLTDKGRTYTADEGKELLRSHNGMMISFLADSTLFFLPLDCHSFSVLKRVIIQSRGAITNLTSSQSILDAFDTLQKHAFIKTTYAAFRIAGIYFEVVRSTIVAKIDVQRFDNIFKKLTADNIIISGRRPSPKHKNTKKNLSY